LVVASSSVVAVLASVTERLAKAGCASPRVDAEILLAHVLGTSRAGLYAESRKALTPDEEAALELLAARRERREPVAYVLGEWGFRRLTLRVDGNVLVPRPETEIVVERGLALIEAFTAPRVLDVGTGSGAIALAIADEHEGALVTGIDASGAALAVAAENARSSGLGVQLILWNLFDGLPPGPWDLVIANPPYVRPDEVEALEPEVRDWEPREALVAEGATEAIAAAALDVLEPGGALVLEVAEHDAARVAAHLGTLGYGSVRVTQDLAGRDRVVECTRP
jgi:release factor glutamine methyltransferase